MICPPRKLSPRFARAGFTIDRVTGSHYFLVKNKLQTVAPFHKNVKVGTLKTILNQIGMSVEEFQKLL